MLLKPTTLRHAITLHPRRSSTRLRVYSTMVKATWNGVVLAESDKCEVVEGNQYFPPGTIKKEYFKPSNHSSHCPWKGDASYYTVSVNGQENKDAAWYYQTPLPAAANIKDHIAFWKGVKVEV